MLKKVLSPDLTPPQTDDDENYNSDTVESEDIVKDDLVNKPK